MAESRKGSEARQRNLHRLRSRQILRWKRQTGKYFSTFFPEPSKLSLFNYFSVRKMAWCKKGENERQ